MFLVACTRLYNPLCPSVGRLVGRSHFTIFYDFIFLTSLLLLKYSGDLKYGPATSVAVYPALLKVCPQTQDKAYKDVKLSFYKKFIK